MVYRVHLQHLELDRLSLFHRVARILDVGDAELRHRDEPLDVMPQIHDHTLVHEAQHPAPQVGAHGIRLADAQPWLFLRLLQTQRDPLVLRVHVQDQHLDLVALLHDFGGMLHPLGPRHVGDVNQAVDARLDLHERAERGQVAHLPLDPHADGLLLRQRHPGLFLGLLHAERDLLFRLVDLQYHRFDRLADRHDLRWVAHVALPLHLGDVDQALDPRLELDERAVVRDRDDLALHARAHRVLRGHVLPGVRLQLLQAEADALALPVDVEDLDLDLLPDVHHLGRVRHATIAHVRDVEQSVHAAQIDEGAEVGDVLDDALSHLAYLQLLHQDVALGLTLGFEQTLPDPHEVGLLLREDDHVFLILEMLEEHLDHVPFYERARVLELVDRHGAFRLEADVEDDGGVGHAQYLRFDDLAFFDIGERSLVQLRHLRDFVRRILFVQVGADAEVGVSGSGGGSFGLRLGRVFRIYQHSGHRFGCGFGPMGPGTIPGLRNTSSQT